jgi:hypothetical protein
MPENASRFAAALFDQFEDEHQVADWGGDELFTRMPRPRAVDDAPPPRFRRALTLVEPSVDPPSQTAEQAMRERAERLSLVTRTSEPATAVRDADGPARHIRERDEPGAIVHRFDASGSLVEPPTGARRSKVITGHPGGAPRPLSNVAARRRPARTPAEWIGPRPERIVSWAFVLGLVLILIALLTG